MKNRGIVTGVESFLKEDHSKFRGKKIALLSNYSSVDSGLNSTIELLNNTPGLDLTYLLAPEHGISGNFQAGENVPDHVDTKTGIMVKSLYDQETSGSIRSIKNIDERMRKFDINESGKKISRQVLSGIDIIIFDLQDIGTRIYTFIATLGYIMRSISGSAIELIILDRPNPITGRYIEGPVLEFPGFSSFVGFYSIPVRHGMTTGELALLFNDELFTNSVNLSVIPLQKWNRGMWFDETGMSWINPSPNIPSLKTSIVYPGMVFFEGTNISEGRGTTIPFEIIGAPWMDGVILSDDLNKQELKGVLFRNHFFTPAFSKYSGKECSGVRLFVTDRELFAPFKVMLFIISAIIRLFPGKLTFHNEYFNRIMGNSWVLDMISHHSEVHKIINTYNTDLNRFQDRREKFLLYK